jgi:hypothetical protein
MRFDWSYAVSMGLMIDPFMDGRLYGRVHASDGGCFPSAARPVRGFLDRQCIQVHIFSISSLAPVIYSGLNFLGI